jgi:hypothetical protein
MKANQWQNTISRAILVFSLLFGTAMILSATAQAQYPQYPNDPPPGQDRDRNNIGRNWDRYGNYGGSAQLRQTALNAGYNEGIKEGRKVRDHGTRTDYHNLSTYRSATKDYNSRLGDREIYRQYFREAFTNGFNAEAYGQESRYRNDRYRDRNNNGNQNRRARNWDRYDNYGGSFQLRQTGLNAGYNEGIKQGRKDRNRPNGNYENQSVYQKATKDYSSRLGDRELYRRYFREGYGTGYDDGINGF